MATEIMQIHIETGGGGVNRFHEPYSQYTCKRQEDWAGVKNQIAQKSFFKIDK
jgi:hypothetical protein